ncbi:helix-turn-helix transcriptional regulator [Cohnella silvisoli]|uniref:AraC family transcriptional regulator n=1 Tax=Cohnella silvisoli TaxID=2873699 RepID=A0ABV1KLF3_9BACL|nr:AraC family transcriptional regulator [Cohnella silvisoli]MCD9020717.1 AraC family transcriptional regulator [Cohnella silvisoli]
MLKLLAESTIDPELSFHYAYRQTMHVTSDPHDHDFFEIFVTFDPVNHYVNGVKQELASGILVFIRPEDQHYYETIGTAPFHIVNIAFPQEVFDSFNNYLEEPAFVKGMLECELPPVLKLQPFEPFAIKSSFQELAFSSNPDKTILRHQFKMLLLHVFVQYFQRLRNDAKSSIPQWLQELKVIMQQKEHFVAGLPKLIELSGKSQEHLGRSIKKHYGMTPTEWLNGFKLQYAASLLLHTEESIIDISIEAGFDNLSHFYHVFKRYYKLSPARYRKVNKKVIVPQ